MSKPIDRDKVLGYFKNVECADLKIKWALKHIEEKLNDGDFDEEEKPYKKELDLEREANWHDDLTMEAVKSEWKPDVGDMIYIPFYLYRWDIKETIYMDMDDEEVVDKGEAFKTESDCKRYMNQKGWINEKEWEV